MTSEAGALTYELDILIPTARFVFSVEGDAVEVLPEHRSPEAFVQYRALRDRAPVVGMTYHPQLAKRWRLQAHLDWIGPGGDAYSAVSGQARAEWEPIRHILVTAGYGFSTEKFNATLDTARFASKDIHLDYTLYGPVLGIGFRF